ncbi:hypothetical protein BV22DRAFT_1200067 [Leucogyrophana mollusca]|uniref:Uncharacterized protein n=1 Tax=Leucogyrophana mollusca TaxID=85980 RepID=A0ACB8B0H8_9AGAM|nr:hypothetical protein BV22DRAFT_1200067 [Leucogyrophana mollusca]
MSSSTPHPPVQPNSHPYAIKTTSSALLSRSTSSPHSPHVTKHHYVPPSPTRPRHRHSSSLSSVEGVHDPTRPAPLPAPPSVRPRRAETLPPDSPAPSPKYWSNDDLSQYLSTANAGEDVVQLVRAREWTGKDFLRLTEDDLQNASLPPTRITSLLEASRTLRADVIKSRIWVDSYHSKHISAHSNDVYRGDTASLFGTTGAPFNNELYNSSSSSVDLLLPSASNVPATTDLVLPPSPAITMHRPNSIAVSDASAQRYRDLARIRVRRRGKVKGLVENWERERTGTGSVSGSEGSISGSEEDLLSPTSPSKAELRLSPSKSELFPLRSKSDFPLSSPKPRGHSHREDIDPNATITMDSVPNSIHPPPYASTAAGSTSLLDPGPRKDLHITPDLAAQEDILGGFHQDDAFPIGGGVYPSPNPTATQDAEELLSVFHQDYVEPSMEDLESEPSIEELLAAVSFPPAPASPSASTHSPISRRTSRRVQGGLAWEEDFGIGETVKHVPTSGVISIVDGSPGGKGNLNLLNGRRSVSGSLNGKRSVSGSLRSSVRQRTASGTGVGTGSSGRNRTHSPRHRIVSTIFAPEAGLATDGEGTKIGADENATAGNIEAENATAITENAPINAGGVTVTVDPEPAFANAESANAPPAHRLSHAAPVALADVFTSEVGRDRGVEVVGDDGSAAGPSSSVKVDPGTKADAAGEVNLSEGVLGVTAAAVALEHSQNVFERSEHTSERASSTPGLSNDALAALSEDALAELSDDALAALSDDALAALEASLAATRAEVATFRARLEVIEAELGASEAASSVSGAARDKDRDAAQDKYRAGRSSRRRDSVGYSYHAEESGGGGEQLERAPPTGLIGLAKSVLVQTLGWVWVYPAVHPRPARLSARPRSRSPAQHLAMSAINAGSDSRPASPVSAGLEAAGRPSPGLEAARRPSPGAHPRRTPVTYALQRILPALRIPYVILFSLALCAALVRRVGWVGVKLGVKLGGRWRRG